MRRLAVLGGEPRFPAGLPFFRPARPPLERVVARLAPSYDQGVLTNGPLVRRFEEEAAARLGVPHVVAVSSCTAGLMLAIQALRPARRPIVLPSFTFSASAHVVAWNGSVPIFAECDPRSFQLDLDDAARRLQQADAGVLMATHVFGAPCGPAAVEELGRRAGVPVVFDAAHGFGATAGGVPVGGFGAAEVFSLSPTKPLVAGEGGLVATRDADVAEHVRLGRDYGNPGDYDTRFAGLNARMSELHAALALESLAENDEHLRIRRALARRYRSYLDDVPGITPQRVEVGDESTYKDFTVTVDEATFGVDRDVVVQVLRAEGIDTRCYFWPPVHAQHAYAADGRAHLPVTEAAAGRVVSLPLWRDLPDQAAEVVVEVLAALRESVGEVAERLAVAPV